MSLSLVQKCVVAAQAGKDGGPWLALAGIAEKYREDASCGTPWMRTGWSVAKNTECDSTSPFVNTWFIDQNDGDTTSLSLSLGLSCPGHPPCPRPVVVVQDLLFVLGKGEDKCIRTNMHKPKTQV